MSSATRTLLRVVQVIAAGLLIGSLLRVGWALLSGDTDSLAVGLLAALPGGLGFATSTVALED